jgi:outer membrane receptor protein involved in Fe transport
VKEVFGEIGIPILKNLPLIHSLSLEGAIRYSDYSTVGSVLAYKGGAEYAPISWLRFRGAYNRAVRAPNVGELFSAVTQGFTSGLDPCDIDNHPSTAQQQLCVKQGISQADLANFHQATLGLTVSSGGNPDLKEEKSNTYTIGAVISPPFIPHLNLTVDYYNVTVKGAITSVNVQQTLNDCFANLDTSSPTCQAIHRLPGSGQIDFVSTQEQNIGSLKTAGIDAQLDYTVRLPDSWSINSEPSQFSLAAVGSWMFHNTTQTLSNSPPQDCAGYYGAGCSNGTGGFILPNFKLNLSGTLTSGPISLRVVGRMIGKLKAYPTVTAFVNRVPAVWYEDATLSFQTSKQLNFYVGVDNLSDKQPPILGTTLVGDANVDVSLYDVEGRRFFVGANLKF